MSIHLADVQSFKDAVVTVMGLGRYKQGSGIGAAKWLLRHGAQMVITDLKTEEELQESVKEITSWYERYKEMYPDRNIYSPVFVLGEHRADNFTDVDLVVQNPGVPKESEFVQLAKQHGVSVESDVSLFFRFCPFPIYAVTGTRGKSTTTALIGEILKALNPKAIVAGNMAVSPLEYLDELLEEKESIPIVLELSSWLIDSLETVPRGPEISVLTNVFEDHLNRYGSFADYIRSKEAMFHHQTAKQKAVLNFDHEIVREIGSRVHAQKFWFSHEQLAEEMDGAYVENGTIFFREKGKSESILPVAEMRLQGEHNVQNALAAVATGRIAGASLEIIAQVLRTFVGLPGRQELVREVNGVVYINDTTATSPDGTIAALEHFGKKANIILLAGGSSKNLSLEKLGNVIRATCKFVVLLEGDATAMFAAAIGDSVPTVQVVSMADAVMTAARMAQTDDVILLSPGTASFGMFKNEYDRGGQFVDAVKRL
ncbi:MAG: UDP-N-acetylmuramoylalanine-D-glutamate ligase [Candidatus Uhrbacteria bacterium GW2011_GWF2_41_16]|jgi:UDP-N-acetylmuramoylalanine--D-glutamate ligase|uniref:UDP-N-acetylmuramoylalanine--D-glutamate ligase n=2 Tax=Candidatus Uhriibacteriota TaxID=1752732 RepID=A0A0G0YCK6_9BACT|nr:MAG: UDP-N-acetylmuramoylalanine-D-glutamate ligase [Candidatus Uhrbacteria bacterium GW2011_GWC2_41_11]KKR98057.1 MAG: UDP-N-acetylmuramoylalanine-D-glutamate ligase [Candidatus Uhrbacteria bacterium GW2011_GWF2_41_16]HBO99676.1 UDP-N-acetylmuramoyl-L-alanine--D-glutamate ligase [Candidatus Uhrbacteria bacterium]